MTGHTRNKYCTLFYGSVHINPHTMLLWTLENIVTIQKELIYLHLQANYRYTKLSLQIRYLLFAKEHKSTPVLSIFELPVAWKSSVDAIQSATTKYLNGAIFVRRQSFNSNRIFCITSADDFFMGIQGHSSMMMCRGKKTDWIK